MVADSLSEKSPKSLEHLLTTMWKCKMSLATQKVEAIMGFNHDRSGTLCLGADTGNTG